MSCKVCIDKRVKMITPQGLKFAIAEKGKQWKNGDTLLLHFLEGTKKEQDMTLDIAKELLLYANLYYEVTTNPELSDIRISYKQGYGSWSYMGTDSLLIQKKDATINFGWELDKATILHEFMHAVAGAGHEHQHPDITLDWIIEIIMADLGWTREDVIHQIVTRYSRDQIIGDTYDKTSILHYFSPKTWNRQGIEMKQNTELSAGDMRLLKKLYPKPTTDNQQLTIDASKVWTDYFSLVRMDLASFKRLANELKIDTSKAKTKFDHVNLIANKLKLH